MKSQKNPYIAMLRQPITIRLDRGDLAPHNNSLKGQMILPN